MPSLYGQCATLQVDGDTDIKREACDRLANVYVAAVRAFGGKDAKRDTGYVGEYQAAVEAYEQVVKEAQDKGIIPKPD